MLGQNLKTSYRNLKRNKLFSIINISGLALGIASSLLILLWIGDEYSMDNFHQHNNELYQVYERNYSDGKVEAGYPTQGLLGEQLKNTIPEIKYASGFEKCEPIGESSVFSDKDKSIRKEGYFASSDFFKMFNFPFVAGFADQALDLPNTIAISKEMAVFFFGTPQNALNKSIQLNNEKELKITAVFNNLPTNSSLQFDFIRCWSDFIRENKWVSNWGNTDPQTFIQLIAGTNALQLENKIKNFIYRYRSKDNSFVMELGLQKFSEKYLHSNFKNGYPNGGRIDYIKIFIILAIFVLIIASINFMNLATAQTAKREKEVGIRKVSGATRASLIFQFITEALVITAIAITIALTIVALLLPIFNNLTGKHIVMPFSNWKGWLTIILFLLVIGISSGSYPAFYLSSSDPTKVLKGQSKADGRAIFIRKGLVVFQFILSISLVVGTIVVYKQLNYIQTTNLGYDRENLLYIPIEGSLNKEFSNFKNEALKLPGVINISKMRNSPTQIEHHVTDISWSNKPKNLAVPFADGVVGYDFSKTLNLQLNAGRDFSTKFGTDSASYIINETAMRKIGWKDAVGKSIKWGNRRGEVIGVLKDFHFNSLHQDIEPLILRLDENWPWGIILFRIRSDQTKFVLDRLKSLCKNINPGFPFTYNFSDDEFSKLYKSETVVSKLSNCFAFLGILISCLGLFGLSAFMVAQRTKEIGVRKILGASVSNILVLLYSNFLHLILIAMLIAFPVSWIVMNHWLQGFAYKTKLSLWYFVLAGVLTLVIAIFTIGHQAYKAARANPVGSLKSD